MRCITQTRAMIRQSGILEPVRLSSNTLCNGFLVSTTRRHSAYGYMDLLVQEIPLYYKLLSKSAPNARSSLLVHLMLTIMCTHTGNERLHTCASMPLVSAGQRAHKHPGSQTLYRRYCGFLRYNAKNFTINGATFASIEQTGIRGSL